MEGTDYWRELFAYVNDHIPEPVAFVPANADYYARQIWELTNEGDLPYWRCEKIARRLCS